MSSTHARLSAEQAQELFNTGNFLLVSDLPAESLVGLDGTLFSCTSKFSGFKFLTPGIHLLVVCPKDQFVKQGIWLNFDSPRQIKSLTYDTKEEMIGNVDQSIAISEQSLRTLDPHLAPFAIHNVLPPWKGLTSCIDYQLLKRIAGETLKVDSLSEEEGEKSLKFTPFDIKKSWPQDAIGEERTKLSQDKSWLLIDVIKRAGGMSALIGELQLSFLLSTLVHIPIAMLHHESILRLFCGAIDLNLAPNLDQVLGISNRPELPQIKIYLPFLKALSIQLASLRRDFFKLDLPGQEDVWVTSLQSLYRTREWIEIEFIEAWNMLFKVCNNFGWSIQKHKGHVKFLNDLDEENPDDLPIIVDS